MDQLRHFIQLHVLRLATRPRSDSVIARSDELSAPPTCSPVVLGFAAARPSAATPGAVPGLRVIVNSSSGKEFWVRILPRHRRPLHASRAEDAEKLAAAQA